MQRTSRQVAYSEAVLDPVAGLSVAPTLQAGVFPLRRLQHVVAAQTLKRENAEEYFMSNESSGVENAEIRRSGSNMRSAADITVLPECRHSKPKNAAAPFQNLPLKTECDERQLVENVSYHNCGKN